MPRMNDSAALQDDGPGRPRRDLHDPFQRLTFQRESDVFPQPELSESLAAERDAINTRCFNGGIVSPESLIRRSMEGGIGFLDLYSYHGTAINPAGRQFAEAHPEQNFVNVGMEFAGEGRQLVHFDGQVTNTYYINYDAYRYMKRLPDKSVGHIQIDFPCDGYSRVIEGDSFKRVKTTVAYLEEIKRVLTPGGTVELYVPIEDKSMYKHAMVRGIGFQSATFPPRTYDDTDLLARRPHWADQIVRLRGQT